MTVDELSNVARVLSEHAWCRYWVDWFGTPPSGSGKMALSVRRADGTDYEPPPEVMGGFSERRVAGRRYWVVERTG